MNDRFITPRRVLIALAVLLLINSLVGRKYAQAVGRPLSHGVDTVLVPLTFIFGTFADTLRPAPAPERYENDQDLDRVIAEREEFRAMTTALLQEVGRLNEKLKRYEWMRASGLYDGVRVIEARVLSYNGNRRNPIITIDHGSRHGVTPGLSVEMDTNLVGIVSSVGPRTSRVALITKAGSKYPVTLESMEPQVPVLQVPEIAHLREDGQSFYIDVDIEGPGEKGDYAHLADDLMGMPRHAIGRILGRVSEVQPHPTQSLLKRLVIRPTLPLTNLPRVLVLVPVTGEEGGNVGGVEGGGG